MSETTPILIKARQHSDHDDEAPGLDSDGAKYSPDYLYRNFLAMALAFSVNHGCVVACLAYASALLGDSLGSVGSGILYVGYAVSAFLISKPMVTMMGPQAGLFVGVIGYCLYVGGFLFAVISNNITSTLAWVVMCLSAGIGGIAGGLLWTAQGLYFSEHCKHYAKSTGLKIEAVTSDFAGIFAALFLGMELCTKVVSTILYLIAPVSGTIMIFTVYMILTVISCFVIARIDDLGDKGTWDLSYHAISHDAGAAAKLVYVDHRLALVTPFQVAFGFASSFVPFYVFGTVIADSTNLGTAWVGVLSALPVLSGAIASIPAARVAKKYSKALVIFTGGMCFLVMGFVFFAFSNDQLGTWAFIIPLMVIYGVGRGVWENTNKAVIADFYVGEVDQCTAAFAATSFFNGYASAMGYFTFPYLPRLGMAGIVTLSSLISMFCYHLAFFFQEKYKTEKSIDKKALIRERYLAHMAGTDVDHRFHDQQENEYRKY